MITQDLGVAAVRAIGICSEEVAVVATLLNGEFPLDTINDVVITAQSHDLSIVVLESSTEVPDPIVVCMENLPSGYSKGACGKRCALRPTYFLLTHFTGSRYWSEIHIVTPSRKRTLWKTGFGSPGGCIATNFPRAPLLVKLVGEFTRTRTLAPTLHPPLSMAASTSATISSSEEEDIAEVHHFRSIPDHTTHQNNLPLSSRLLHDHASRLVYIFSDHHHRSNAL